MLEYDYRNTGEIYYIRHKDRKARVRTIQELHELLQRARKENQESGRSRRNKAPLHTVLSPQVLRTARIRPGNPTLHAGILHRAVHEGQPTHIQLRVNHEEARGQGHTRNS